MPAKSRDCAACISPCQKQPRIAEAALDEKTAGPRTPSGTWPEGPAAGLPRVNAVAIRQMYEHDLDCVTIHTSKFRGAKMKQSIVLIGAAMAIAAGSSTAALARKAKPCDVVGFWTA